MEHSKDLFLKVKDFLVSGEEFSLCYNHEKKFLETSPKPRAEDLARYYESDAYISHTDSKKGLFNFLYQLIKKHALSKKVSLIKKLNNGTGALLDVGAGTGDFLKKAKDANWKIHGVEVNELARERSREKGVVLKTDLAALGNKQFDVITLWHVLEHIPNLEETIDQLESLLRPSGHLVIAVPNYKSYDSQYYQNFWAAYDVPRHLWHFSRESIPLLFSNRVSLKSVIPMQFDSFYVSLLSEKYKTGKKFSLKALFVGLRSNLKAMRSKEYSSLIYCLQKQ